MDDLEHLSPQEAHRINQVQWARQVASLRSELHKAKELLRYVAFHRWPLGDTTFEHLDFERQKAIDALLGTPDV